ncbi:Retrovirus-related Pol polyprotein from transposon TNT 1-94 [Dendrobium catenatum]|uniref:Retrovirus-related Pol polyprotein from transposon TNT 1-94 n=1 Tax=Dendrobium catenatum TaxID=906689 RepID=A0A2I0WAD5_9ASPA|nr:Retrovirus-related Pol polyprotein from transposon TNT 1-94 [Dendrobium catenatum]
MKAEFDALQQQSTWTLVPPPSGKPVLGCKWTYKINLLPNGQLDRYKAQLVSLGYDQKFCKNYNEIFSLVAKMPTIRLLLTLSLNRDWPVYQLDIANAFLDGDLPDDIYMCQPPGFTDQNQPQAVCKLHKSLYGLKQAPRQWFQKLTSFLQQLGFGFSRFDPSLLIFHQNGVHIYILIYVDDFLVTGNDEAAIRRLLTQLQKQFALKQLGNISLFLGIQVPHTKQSFFLSQEHYATKILNDAGYKDCKAAPTPVTRVTKLKTPNLQLHPDPSLYRRIAGSLQYISITRPDIAFATNRVCQHMQSPTEQDFKELKRLLRYIKGTLSYGLPITTGSLELRSYSDADWASNTTDQKSVSGFCTFIGPQPHLLDGQKASNRCQIIHRSRVPVSLCCRIRRNMAQKTCSRTQSHATIADHHTLRQHLGHGHSQKSSVSCKNEAYRDRLPLHPSANHLRQHQTRAHLLQRPNSGYSH